MAPVGRLIAIVDDEENILQTVAYALRREGYEVETFTDGQRAWEAFQSRLPDLAILDIILPRIDGLELCRRLRGLSAHLPIIFLTSKTDEFDRVLGLELGGDDYLCKPFSCRELIARVKVLFRRTQSPVPGGPETNETLQMGHLKLDLNRFEAFWKSSPVPLTVTEFRILHSLARFPGHVKTRDQLMTAAYPEDTFVSDRTIDSHIKRLRRKFSELDPAFSGIETVYGLGYRLGPGCDR
jgi:two-component system, OmpR family, response regulator ChvI